jgi:hypothetical protein
MQWSHNTQICGFCGHVMWKIPTRTQDLAKTAPFGPQAPKIDTILVWQALFGGGSGLRARGEGLKKKSGAE